MVAVVGFVIVGGLLYLQFGQKSEEVSGPTPTPTVTVATPDLDREKITSTLTGIFGQFYDITISEDRLDPLADFQFEAITLSNTYSLEQSILAPVLKSPSSTYDKFSEFLDHFSISFPINLVSFVDNNDFALILTKQTEFFDQTGGFMASPSAESLLTPKIALAVRVVDVAETQTQLNLWERTLLDDLSSFYGLGQVNLAIFSDNTYQGVSIRFLNSDYPDQAIDYAIVSAKNGNDYLIIANSRQQIYSIIDKLLGF